MPKPEVDATEMDLIDLASSEEDEEEEGPVIQGVVHNDFEHGEL